MKSKYRFLFLILLFVGLVVRLVYLKCTGLPLTEDEAYYWDWSRHPALSYYSKGPMVAYLIWLSTHLLDNGELAVRMPAIILGGVTSIFTYFFARGMFRCERTAFWTAVTFMCIPIFNVGSVLITIDNPLFCCWTMALTFLWAAITQGKWRFWIASGVALGLGIMAKAVIVFFVPSMLLYLALSPSGRKHLWTARPWILLGVAALFFVPQIVWNAQHDWAMFGDFARKGGSGQGFRLEPGQTLEFLATQIGIISPVIFAAAAMGFWTSLKRGLGRGDEAWLFLFCFSVVLVGFYTLLSLKVGIQANWMMVAYLPLVTAGVRWFLEWHDQRRAETTPGELPWYKRSGRWAQIGLGLGLIGSLGLFATGPIYALNLPFPVQADPSNRLWGWPQLAQRVDELVAEYDAAGKGPMLRASSNYQFTALMAYYGEGQPYAWNFYRKGRRNQYYFIHGDDIHQLGGRNAIYVVKKESDLENVKYRVDKIEKLETLQLKRGDKVIREVYVYYLENIHSPWYYREALDGE